MKKSLKKQVAEAKREYMRNWRRQNPEKQKLYAQRYWEKKVKQLEEQDNERRDDTT